MSWINKYFYFFLYKHPVLGYIIEYGKRGRVNNKILL